MQDEFITTQQSIALLYGDTFYLVGDNAAPLAMPPKVEAKAAEAKQSAPSPKEPATPMAPEASVETPASVESQPPRNPGITWRTKPSSKMLFILQQAELKDPILTDFLKKIVEAIGIPFESAGFGIINGPVNLHEFNEMPNRYAVVFDGDLWMQPNVATTFGDKEVFFTLRLAFLQNDAESKRQLWGYLKNLKDMLQ